MKETGIVPVFFNSDVEIAKNVVKACYEGGIRAFEFTNRGDFAIEVFKELSKYVLAECPGLILGAGTILDAPTAALYIQMGANFIVSPSLNPEVAKLCNRHGIPNNLKKFLDLRKYSYICSPKNKSNLLRVVIKCA